MRAAVFQALGEPLQLEQVPDPAPEPGELLVRVRASGICGTDVHNATISGLPRGSVMGHEFAGEVVEVGREAGSDWRVGDRVCGLPLRGCARCRHCLAGDPVRCETLRYLGMGDIGGAYAELVRLGAAEAVRLPEGVDFRAGAMVEPLAVALHAVQQGDVASKNVLVMGAGPIGLATALWARFFGAREVIVSERVAARLELAGKLGASGGIDASSQQVGPAFAAQAGGPPDVVFECVGVPGRIQDCMGLVRPRGLIVVVGLCMEPDSIFPVVAVTKEVELRFVLAYGVGDFHFIARVLEAGRVGAGAMVTDVVDLEHFPQAFEGLKRPSHECKVLLEP
jgi:(R,R)-butanediol dehydrogenase/meso-butanediol dehydrogenase/diacetyl reductase